MFSLSSFFFLLKKNCKNDDFVHFFQHRLCRKNFMFCVLRSLLIFSFSFICFSCRFLFDFSRSSSQHASLFEVSSLPLYFLFLFILFLSVLIFVSSCFLVSFTFSPFLNFLFFCLFIISMFLYVALFV